MRVTIADREYRADTAVGLVDEIKFMLRQGKDMNVEKYIAKQQHIYKSWTGKSLRLPEGDLERKALAMFYMISDIGGWKFVNEN
jgi:hypothetical protein